MWYKLVCYMVKKSKSKTKSKPKTKTVTIKIPTWDLDRLKATIINSTRLDTNEKIEILKYFP